MQQSPSNTRLSWSPDGKTLASPVGSNAENYMSVVTVSVASGEIKFFTSHKWAHAGVRSVAWLADGQSLLVTAQEQLSGPFQLWQVSYPAGEVRKITNDLNSYLNLTLTADSSRLAMVQTETFSNIWVMPAFDAARATPLTEGRNLVRTPSWTPDGKIVYSSNAGGSDDLYVIDARGGNPKQLTANARSNVEPSVSPDGRHLVFTSDRTGVSHLWRMDLEGENLKQLTAQHARSPQVSPDSQWVVYRHDANYPSIWKVAIDGSQTVQLTQRYSLSHAISPDGKQIACFYEAADAPLKLAFLPFAGGPPSKTFTVQTRPYSTGLRWTVDGRALVYSVTRNGVSNLWAQPVDGSPPKQLTNFTADLIFWFDFSHDGKQLALARGTQTSDVVLISEVK